MYSSMFLIILTKSFRSLSNSQYTLLDSVTMRTVGSGSKIKSARDDSDGPHSKLLGLESQGGDAESSGENGDAAVNGTAPEGGDVAVASTAVATPTPPAKSSYGSARVWGSIGWAAASPVVGLLIDRFGVNVIFAYT